jgi:hypothetical protein
MTRALERLAALTAIGVALIAPSTPAATFLDEASAHLPADTAVIFTTSSMRGLFDNSQAFMSACAPQMPAQAYGETLAQWVGMGIGDPEGSGVATSGPALEAFRVSDFSSVKIFTLSDPGAFTQALAATGATDSGTHWTSTPDPMGRVGVAAVRGNLALISSDASLLSAAASSAAVERLRGGLTAPQPGTGLLLIDLPSLITAHEAKINQQMGMMMAMAGSMPSQGGVDMGHVMEMYSQMLQKALNVGREVRSLGITFLPRAEGLAIRSNVALQESSALRGVLPRHIESSLSLADQLPGGATMAMASTYDAERCADLFTEMVAVFIGMAGDDAGTQAAAGNYMEKARALYQELGDQIAWAMYPSDAGVFIPRTVTVMRAREGSNLLDDMVALMTDTEAMALAGTMMGVSGQALTSVDEGTMQVAGHAVRHMRLDGFGALMQQQMQMSGAPAPVTFEDPHYWFTETEDTLIATSEPDTTLMTQVLSGQGQGLQVPAQVQGLANGADVLVQMNLLGLMRSMGPMMMMGGMPAVDETGIWGSLKWNDDGASGMVLIPSADVAAFSNMMMGMMQQGMQGAPPPAAAPATM